MDKDLFLKYAPLAIVVVTIILQWNIFVTPEQLEIKHREILSDIAKNYTTKEQHNDLRNEITAMKITLDKIYDILYKNGG